MILQKNFNLHGLPGKKLHGSLAEELIATIDPPKTGVVFVNFDKQIVTRKLHQFFVFLFKMILRSSMSSKQVGSTWDQAQTCH